MTARNLPIEKLIRFATDGASVMRGVRSGVPLISDSQTDPTAKEILTFITTFQFLASTHFLCDVLPTLLCLSKAFQRQCVDFSTVTDAVQTAISPIEGFKHAPGPPCVATFLSDVPDNRTFLFQEATHFGQCSSAPTLKRASWSF